MVSPKLRVLTPKAFYERFRGIMATLKRTKGVQQVKQDAFRPHMKELRLAYRRIGSSPIKRLDWLVRFAYENPAALSAGQLTDRRWDLIMFSARGAKPEEFGWLADVTD